jgi:ribosome-binding factor A
MNKRIARLNEQLKRELSDLIRTQVRDPRVGIVTITGVEVAADLGSAKIYVRDLGGAEHLAATLEGLEAAAPFLRTTLGRSLRVRRIPELRFREDRSLLHARRIEEVLADVVIPEEEVDEDAGKSTREGAPEGSDGHAGGGGHGVDAD